MCNDERPRVHLDINGMQVTPLINTGSTHTLMETAVYKRLPRLTPLYATQPLQSIFEHELPIKGACVVCIGNLRTEVLVVNRLEWNYSSALTSAINIALLTSLVVNYYLGTNPTP